MKIQSFIAPLAFSLFALTGLFGCQTAQEPGDDDSDGDVSIGEEPGASPEAYHVRTKVSTPSYHCGGSVCTCYGDDDCNEMFSGGACGGPAICHDDSSGVWCECVSVGGSTQ